MHEGEVLNEYFVAVFTKGKDIENSEISVEKTKMHGQFEIEMVVLGALEEH